MGQQQQEKKASLFRKRCYRFFRAVTLLLLLVIAFVVGIIAGLFAVVSKDLPSGEELDSIHPSTPTRILASDNTVLAKITDENREVVPIDRMGFMPKATLAIEDIRFNDHPGIDLRGIARALVKNLRYGDSKEGASTITQQLARNLFIKNPKKTITRKLQEMVLALELERRYSKQEILEAYLNQIYYGTNKYSVRSYGVQAAAKSYFKKDVSKLTLAEAALLAGLPKSPTGYNPYKNPKQAVNRRNLVLRNMYDYGLIDRKQYEKAKKEKLKLAPQKRLEIRSKWHAPYFINYILNSELRKIYGQDTDDYVRYGLDIYTSLDPRMQQVAEKTINDGVNRNRFRNIHDGALISIDPKTGYIKAMVGGTDFLKDEYNIITLGHRQPGSSFKPFVYAAALLHGYTPKTRVSDKPSRYPAGNGKYWTPKNSDGRYRGSLQLQQALWSSRNAVAVAVANDVGIQSVIDLARSMGIKYDLEPYLSTALGASVVVPMEICSAYGGFANGGVHNPSAAIVRITTDGGVIYEHSAEPRRVIPTEVANTMKTMMRGVIERGTASAIRPLPFEASGKTGTTDSFHDAWFIGYTDDLVTAVWVGNRDNAEMNHTFGATVPAPLWKQYMLIAQPIMSAEHRVIESQLAAANNLPESNNVDMSPSPYIVKHGGYAVHNDVREPTTDHTNPPPPDVQDRYTVMICKSSHMRATSWCPDVKAVTYYHGRAPYPPSRTCSEHTGPSTIPDNGNGSGNSNNNDNERGVVISVCAATGKIATSNCPNVFRRRFKPEDAPTETCPLHAE